MPRRKRATKPTTKTPGRRDALLALIKQYRQKLAIASACYQAADDLLQQIQSKVRVGRRVPIGDGLYVVLVDLFEAADKVFKPVAVKRYELQIQDAGGRVVRMRDRKRGK